jgi:hypothetical protein
MGLFLYNIKKLTKKYIYEWLPIQLTHKIRNNKKLTNKNMDKKKFIPILITVFSVLYYFKCLQVFQAFHILKIYVYNSLMLINKYISYLFIINKKYLFFENLENVYYNNISTDRNVLYEKYFKLIINDGFKSYPNIFTNLFYLIDNSVNSHNDNILEIINFISIVLFSVTYLFLIHKIKYFFVFALLYFSILVIPLILYIAGIDIYFYDYNYIYSIFKIVESFLNRNVYVDSNYFLTSDSLRGIEKFTDISVPWLVDYEDSGWGGDFDIQNQIDI